MIFTAESKGINRGLARGQEVRLEKEDDDFDLEMMLDSKKDKQRLSEASKKKLTVQ